MTTELTHAITPLECAQWEHPHEGPCTGDDLVAAAAEVAPPTDAPDPGQAADGEEVPDVPDGEVEDTPDEAPTFPGRADQDPDGTEDAPEGAS